MMLDVLNNDIFYSPEDLSERLDLSLTSIYKLLRSGEVPSIRLGKVYRIPASALRQLFRSKGVPVPHIPPSAEELVRRLQTSPFQDRIRAVYLYGSYARGDYDIDSDVDLCLVVADLDLETRRLISSYAEKAMRAIDYAEILSVKEEDERDWDTMRRENYPFVQNVTREGISLWNSR